MSPAFDALSCAEPTKHALARDHPLITMHWQNVFGWTSVTPFKAREGKDGDVLFRFETQLSQASLFAHFALFCTYPSFVMDVTDVEGGKQEKVASIEHTASCCGVGRLRAYTVRGNVSEYVGEVVPGCCFSAVGQISNASAEPVGKVVYTQHSMGGLCGKEELTLLGALGRRCALTLADQTASQPAVYEMRSEEAVSEAEKLLLMSAVLFTGLVKEELAV